MSSVMMPTSTVKHNIFQSLPILYTKSLTKSLKIRIHGAIMEDRISEI